MYDNEAQACEPEAAYFVPDASVPWYCSTTPSPLRFPGPPCTPLASQSLVRQRHTILFPRLATISVSMRSCRWIVAFTDETGKVVPLRTYFDGKPVVLALAYYDCPMLCTLVLNGLTKALRTLSLSVGTDLMS